MKYSSKLQNFLRKLTLFIAVTLTIVLSAGGIVPSRVYAQELDAKVDVDLSAISIDVRDKLNDFAGDVQDYLNKTRFSDENIVNDLRGKPYKIKCNFQFFFKTSSGYDDYGAQMIVSVQRNIYRTPNFTTIFRVRDETWEFRYVEGQNFYHDDNKYNNLTSFLDYYAYMIIGMDDDSWEPSLGSRRFQSAQSIVNLALANGDGNGWFDNSSLKQSRGTYTAELLNSKYDNFRKAFWTYHFAGIDSLQLNKRQALERIAASLEVIGKLKKTEVRSFVIKSFFDAKYLEIATVLVDHYDKSIYRKLMDFDPDHLSTYEEYAKK